MTTIGVVRKSSVRQSVSREESECRVRNCQRARLLPQAMPQRAFCANCAASETLDVASNDSFPKMFAQINCQGLNETIRFLSFYQPRRRNFNVNVQSQSQCSIRSVRELGGSLRRIAGIRR